MRPALAPQAPWAGAANEPLYETTLTLDDGDLHVWTLGDSITIGVAGGFRNDISPCSLADGYEVEWWAPSTTD